MSVWGGGGGGEGRGGRGGEGEGEGEGEGGIYGIYMSADLIYAGV